MGIWTASHHVPCFAVLVSVTIDFLKGVPPAGRSILEQLPGRGVIIAI
jgi:hypothetical protein